VIFIILPFNINTLQSIRPIRVDDLNAISCFLDAKFGSLRHHRRARPENRAGQNHGESSREKLTHAAAFATSRHVDRTDALQRSSSILWEQKVAERFAMT
jgi:hypothetical protein